jgi:magnesium-transporting ATPase (P-type)
VHLTRRIPAVETLGAITVLCVDKTGTLTLNQMSVAMLATDGQILNLRAHPPELPETFHGLVEFGILASHDATLRARIDAVICVLAGLLPVLAFEAVKMTHLGRHRSVLARSVVLRPIADNGQHHHFG